MVFAAGSFVLAAFVSTSVDANGDHVVPVVWIIPQYALLSMGEVLTSSTGTNRRIMKLFFHAVTTLVPLTIHSDFFLSMRLLSQSHNMSDQTIVCSVFYSGLEFAFSQAPPSMKGVVIALYQVTTALGDLMTGVLYEAVGERLSLAYMFFIFAAMMAATTVLFSFIASRYHERVFDRTVDHDDTANIPTQASVKSAHTAESDSMHSLKVGDASDDASISLLPRPA